jgi:hypothetical protein
MTKPTENHSLPLHLKIALGIIAFLLLASCFSRQLNGLGSDFLAYFKAAGHLLEGQSPYSYEKSFSHKYAPSIAIPFTFFHLFSYETARWVYAAFHAIIALTLPYLIYTLLRSQQSFAVREYKETYVMGILISFMGTFRFIDGEFHVSQTGLWMMGSIFLGLLCLQHFSKMWWGKFLGFSLMSLGALVKIYSSVLFLTFIKLKNLKTLLWISGVFIFWMLIPHPSWWLDWVNHLQRASFDLVISRSSGNLQGFYPLAFKTLSFAQFNIPAFVLALPFALWAFYKTHRYSLNDIATKPLEVLLSLHVWLLWGTMASPLPWHYTYSMLWSLIPLMWLAASPIERRWILGVCMFLGLSPQGLLGKEISSALESNQSVFIAVFILWFVLIQVLRKAQSLPDRRTI